MLERLAKDIDNSKAFVRKYLQVSFNLYTPKTNKLGQKEESSIYGEVTKEGKYKEIPKWDEVRKRTLENNKMTIRMQIAALQKLIYGILPSNPNTSMEF